MKPTSTIGLTALFLSASAAFAQTPNLVTLTGDLNPAYIVEMNPAERAAIAEGLEGLQHMPSISVDINSIYSEKDIKAFSMASKEVSRVVLEASKRLVDMRAVVYKIEIALKNDKDHHFTDAIYQAYDKKFQSSFTALLELFLGKDLGLNANLTAAMENCFTTSCVQDIANAQMDLMNFGKSINHRIDLNSTKRWEYQSQNFKSRLVKDSVRMTVDQVLKTNETESVYVKTLRAAAVPFAAAAAGTSESGSALAEFVTSKTAGFYQISADPIVRKKKDWNASLENFQNAVGENYQLIVNNNNGAKAYAKATTQAKNAALSLSTQPVTIPESFMNVLKNLDAAFQKLTSLHSLDEKLAIKMILDSMYVYKEFYENYTGPTNGYRDLLLAVLAEGFQYAKDKNLKLNDFYSYGSGYTQTLTTPISFMTKIVQTKFMNKLWGSGYEDNQFDLGSVRAIPYFQFQLSEYQKIQMITAIHPDTKDLVQLLRYQSKDNESYYFAIGVTDNPAHYLRKDENGDYRINLNPPLPQVEISSLK